MGDPISPPALPRRFRGQDDPLWPDPYLIDFDELRVEGTHDDFMSHAIELFKEVGILATLIASTTIEGEPTYGRNEAIRRGLIIRLSKLANSLLNETCARHGEQQLAIARQLLETAINLLYLLDGEEDLYEAFVIDSLIAETELHRLIQHNIETRGGNPLPIEQRMLRSIESTVFGAGFELESVPPRNTSGWPSVLDRLRELNLESLYVMFRVGSTAIHGGWADIYLHHLEHEGAGRFTPHFDHLLPRPEPLTAMGALLTISLSRYLQREDRSLVDLYQPRLTDLGARITAFDEVHEVFLQRQS